MDHELDTALDGLTPVARPDFVEALAARIAAASMPAPRRSWPRLAAAGGVTGALLAGLAVTGGASYAATAVTQAAHVARHAVVKPKAAPQAIAIRGLSAGGDQYQAGFGFGDPDHNHEGATNMELPGGEKGPPLESTPTPDGKAKVAAATVTFDEQAHLYISVIDGTGTPLLLTQKSKRGSTNVGGRAVDGPQTKFIQYVVRVPRAIPFGIRVPENLLRPGGVYRIRIVAIDPQGNKSTLFVPFRA